MDTSKRLNLIRLKRELVLHLVIIWILFSPILISAQDRGMKPIQVIIEGDPITLYQQSHALLIGLSAYQNGWSPLPGVNKDIPRIETVLEANGFQVDVVMNPTNKEELDNAFTGFISKYGASPENRLLFYYAGHVHTIQTSWGGELGYIVPCDAPMPARDNPSSFQSKAMEMAQVDIYARRIQAKHAIFIFDACFAGRIFTEDRSGVPEYITYNTTKPVRQFITSGSADEVVADASYFCDQFIEALQGKADYDKDGYLTGSELGYFLKNEVIRFSNNRQHPQSGKINDSRLDEGDMVFLLNASSISSTTPLLMTPTANAERPMSQYGSLEVTSKITGDLYLDDSYITRINAYTIRSINNLTEGVHRIKVIGDNTLEQTVNITAYNISAITIDKRQSPSVSWEPDMVFVEGDTFKMGCDDGNKNEKPIHTVTVSNFYLGKYEITQKQWIDIMGQDPPEITSAGCDQCPVERISWNEIQEFLQEFNIKSGKKYRLPTEAEWEYAARGGNQSKGYMYSGSNALKDVAWFAGNSYEKTHPVGQKQPNELGIYDMSGNVWEWCADPYDADYYEKSPKDNPEGPSKGSYRSLRGGSWNKDPEYCRITFRGWSHPGNRYKGPPGLRRDYGGFRLCLDD